MIQVDDLSTRRDRAFDQLRVPPGVEGRRDQGKQQRPLASEAALVELAMPPASTPERALSEAPPTPRAANSGLALNCATHRRGYTAPNQRKSACAHALSGFAKERSGSIAGGHDDADQPTPSARAASLLPVDQADATQRVAHQLDAGDATMACVSDDLAQDAVDRT